MTFTAVLSGVFLSGLVAHGQDLGPGLPTTAALVVTHACFDSTSGDLLVVSNSWRDAWPRVRRIHDDGTVDPSFKLQRFERCCAIHPSLVAADSEGNIYTLEYKREFGQFFMYKHSPTGELDLDWGEREEETPVLAPLSGGEATEGESGEEEGGGYEGAETTLSGNAGGGRLEYPFSDPVDLVPRGDGSLLILDRNQRYVYEVDPEGKSVSFFVGRQGYYPVRPQRLVQDSEGYLYLVDYYDDFDFDRGGMVGVFRFTPDGSLETGWGEATEGINDIWGPTLDYRTLVCDGTDTLVLLGSGFSDSNHGEVFAFDRLTGMMISRNNVEYRLGHDDNFIGMLGALGSGFVVLDSRNFEILVSYYTLEGTRERLVAVDRLYESE